MTLFALVLVGLYGLLNAFLAIAGLFTEPAAPLLTKIVPCLVFAASAATPTWGALGQRSAWVWGGLVLGSLATVLYGALVEHNNVFMYHAVRAAIALVIAGVWWVAMRRA